MLINRMGIRLLSQNVYSIASWYRVPSCKVYNAVPPPQQLLVGVQSSGSETNSNLNSGASSVCSTATSVLGSPVSSVGAPMVTTALRQVAQSGGNLPSAHIQINGFPYSQPLSTGCTSYSGYAGIYPQATPLQQVAQALRQSGPVTSTVAPVTSTTSMISKRSTETGKRPPQKRKFQESPVSLGAAVSQQVQVSSLSTRTQFQR